jgi:hypothetical protein
MVPNVDPPIAVLPQISELPVHRIWYPVEKGTFGLPEQFADPKIVLESDFD